MFKSLMAALAMLVVAGSAFAVDVNRATQAELEALTGVGPAIATKIMDERKKSSFKDWNDFIERVKGVGEGNAAKLSADGLTVAGATYKGVAAAPAAKAADTKADPKATAKKEPAMAKEEKAMAKDDKASKADKAAAAKEDKSVAMKEAKADKAEKGAKAKEDKAAKAEKAGAKAADDKAAAATTAAKEAKKP